MENKTKINRREALQKASAAGLGLLLASLSLPQALAQDAAPEGKKGKGKNKAAKADRPAKADRVARG